MQEGGAEVTLPLRRVAGPEAVQEPLERRLGFEVTRELQPDLGKHLQVSTRNDVARALERIERRVQLGRQAPEPRIALEETVPQEQSPQRLDRVQQPAALKQPALEAFEQVFATDRLAGLARGPSRVRAPVRPGAAAA